MVGHGSARVRRPATWFRGTFGLISRPGPEAKSAATAARRARLLITHDVEGLAEVDEIVVLDHGKVTERGTYDQLTGSEGAFTRLWWQGHPASRPDPDRPDRERIPA